MSTTAEVANPYLAARHVHNERYLSLAKSIRNWQLVTGGLLLANVGLALAITHIVVLCLNGIKG